MQNNQMLKIVNAVKINGKRFARFGKKPYLCIRNQLNKQKQVSVMKEIKEFKASVWCVFVLFAVLLGWLSYNDNPYLNAVVLPIAALAAIMAAAWLQETEFSVKGKFPNWFFNGTK